MSVILGFMIMIMIAIMYFLPAVVAKSRNHPQFVPILLLNIFFGWTFVGWVVALIWSTTAIQK